MRLILSLSIILLLIGLTGFFFMTPTQPTFQPSNFKIQDMVGREVTLQKPINRAIILNSYWNEVASVIGASEKVVAIDKFTTWSVYIPPSTKQLPVVGDVFSGINIETVLSLKPDVVIMDHGYGKTGEIVKSLESIGIPVVCMFPTNFNDQLRAITLLGKVLDAEERAISLVNFMEIRHSTLLFTASKIPDKDRPTVLLCNINKDGLITAIANSSWGRTVEDVGGINVALRELPSQSWPKIDLEKLLAWDPDIIIITDYYNDTLSSRLASIMNNSIWNNLKAVKESRVYTLLQGSKSENSYLDWGPRILIGEMQIAKMVQPKYFDTLDVQKVAELLLSNYYPWKHYYTR
ncbi:MAG: ABC transporter substrate-binding protein [Candidatus Methanomethylicaceae archaeon]